METKTPDTDTLEESPRGRLLAYVTGFGLSLLLTITAYVSVINQSISRHMLIAVIVGLAVAQLLVQLVFFLHLGRESRPRLNLVVFLFMLLVIGILVIGSLWIMYNLDYHMTPNQMDQHLLEQYDKGGI